MRVGIVGGTGEIGEGMALRLSRIMDVCVGSRDPSKAQETCDTCLLSVRGDSMICSVTGGTNQDVVDNAEIIILAIPFKHVRSTVEGITGWEDKIVISPINPMERHDCFVYAPPEEGSAALYLRKLLPSTTRICTAFNNIAGNRWRDVASDLVYSVPVCGDDQDAKREVMDLVNRISHLKAYDAGPLSCSYMVEGITPLLLNIAKYNRIKDVGIRFV